MLLLADIHGNAEALQAVMDDAPEADETLVLGDTMGYGPRPGRCLELLRDRDATMIKGNHDAALNDEIPYRQKFNRHGVAAIDYQKKVMSNDQKQYINDLPKKHTTESYAAYHGSPTQPLWEYIRRPRQAQKALDAAPSSTVLTGHTHEPAIFSGESLECLTPKVQTAQDTSGPCLINPGSVGQPRDRNSDAAYAVMDTDEQCVRFARVNYDIDAVADRIRSAGYDPLLAERLYDGR